MNLYKHYKDQLPSLNNNKFFNGPKGNRSLHKTKQGNYTNAQWLLFNEYL
ncbi:unnamed protein product, partial [marine sediment metagenome]